jgi:hypothetical protein
VLYTAFQDGQLDGERHLLDRLQPATWTAFVQPDTVVDGHALQASPTSVVHTTMRPSVAVAIDG